MPSRMKVNLKFVILALVVASQCAWGGPERLAPELRLLLSRETGPALSPEGMNLPFSATGEIRVLVETANAGDAWALPGFTPSGVWGRIATGILTPAALGTLMDDPRVVFLEPATALRPALDVSVPEVGAPAVWAASPGTRGGGVLVGVVDSGVDPLHLDFRVDRDGDGREEGSRILFLWDQTLPQDGSAASYGLTYGRVYTQAELEAQIAGGYSDSTDSMGHGTHVAGIAVGDGSSSTAGYVGVAPEANLVVVKTPFYEDAVLDGIGFVFARAEELGLPCVVNLSLGGHAGPHDGTGLFEQAVDAFLDRPGRAIVVAAGNEAGERIHVGADVRAPVTWHLIPESSSVSASFWHSFQAAFKVEIAASTGESTLVLPGGQGYLSTSAGQAWVDNSGFQDPRNGDREIYIQITGAAPGGSWAVTLTPVVQGGHVDGWVEDPTAGYFAEGDASRTIAEPGNAPRVITVGAYVTKDRWVSLVGEQRGEGYTVGELAAFSSRGPTRDGRLKPDLCAPGVWIASALSRAASEPDWLRLPDGQHFMLLGTSMAAPHVAGACALLLSLTGDLAWDELLAALTSGARADAFVGPAPNFDWGWGKLDIPAAGQGLSPGPGRTVPKLWLLENPVAREARFLYQLPRDVAWAELRVYTVTGRLLWRTELRGSGEVGWSLVTSRGSPVASGLYLAVVVSDQGNSAILQVVVQR